MFGIAGPHQADLEASHLGKVLAPALRGIGRRAQITHVARNGFEPGPEQPRQAEQHGIALIRRRIAAIAEHGDAWQAFAEKPHQLLMHSQGDAARAPGKRRDVTRELQRIAETLFGLNIDVLAGKAAACPGNFRKTRPLAFGRAKPPFIFVKTLAEFAAHEQENAEPGTGIGVMRRQRDRAAQRGNAFVEAAAVMQRRAVIGPAVGIIRLELDGAAKSGDRLVEFPQSVERIAEIAVGFGEVRRGRDCLALCARRLFVVFQLVERDAEIAQRRRQIRLDGKRTPCLFNGELGPPGKAKHLAEIGVKHRDLWRELGRALHMLDSLGKLAVLMCDDAEEVFDFRRIRLHLEDLTAHRLGFRQPAVVAAALGVLQCLTERHERRWCLPAPIVHCLDAPLS
ncbi:hypothetical protein [Bradyrhizobium sp. NAS96.2]|uniref:hypothetical protein n=1 Tax=Bradyrhizobium sp. NAS96.2 TaxID=1680160 RepID=UPI001FD9CA84|nr:hypothetical protein [Bradyrhizobium sp. NAS96.2]